MTATTTTSKISFRQAINQALAQEMERDERVFLIGEDIVGGAGVEGFESDDAWGGVMGVTKGLVGKFGRERVIDTPLSETAFIGASVGAAMSGLRPVTELMFSEFLGVCLDQIMNQGAKSRYMFGGAVSVPMTLRTTIGAGNGMAGQHSDCNYSIFTHLAGVKTVVPSTPADAKGLLAASIRDDDLVVFHEHKAMYDMRDDVPEGEHVVPLGVADVKREGDDVTIVTVGRMVHTALEAADALGAQGISTEVVDLRTLSPLDEDTVLGSIAKTGRLVMLDEDKPRCAMSGDIVSLAARKAFGDLKAAPVAVTAPHTPVPYAPSLENAYIPDRGRVEQAVLEVLGKA